MAKSKIQYANSDVLVINTNGTNHVKDTFATVMKMVNEFGVSKTHMAIQSLFDTDRIDQNTIDGFRTRFLTFRLAFVAKQIVGCPVFGGLISQQCSYFFAFSLLNYF